MQYPICGSIAKAVAVIIRSCFNMIFLVSYASFRRLSPPSHPSRSSGFAPSPAWKNPLENNL